MQVVHYGPDKLFTPGTFGTRGTEIVKRELVAQGYKDPIITKTGI